MKIKMKSGHMRLFTYFLLLGLFGSFLLQLPYAYKSGEPVPYIDSLFTSVSAVCVTGLSSVDMSVYTNFGFSIILFLIEAGGLGIIAFISMFVAMGSKKISMVSSRVVREYFIDDVEYEPRNILKSILGFTIGIQLLGCILLIPIFYKAGIENFIFDSFFISVSAFCNAGFSIWPDSLVKFQTNIGVNLIVMILIISGGIGFIVHKNVQKFFINPKKNPLSLHSKIVLFGTFFLIVTSAGVYLFFDWNKAFEGLSIPNKIIASFFQSVTTRTAGFETISQGKFSNVSELWSTFLMFIGGSPASMAGGIKTTTFFVVLLFFIHGNDSKGTLTIMKRQIPPTAIRKAISIVAKSVMIVILVLFLLSITERKLMTEKVFSITDIIFEVISAFGTVGLSKGVTPELSFLGKIIIICTMYIGRTGLFAMALGIFSKDVVERFVDYPEEPVLLG